MRQIIFDTREKLTPVWIDKWISKHPRKAKDYQFNQATLTSGDVIAGTKDYNLMIEVKFGSDCHDYHRLHDELWRMAKHHENHSETDLYLLVIDTDNYTVNRSEIKILVSYCEKFGIRFRHAISEIRGIEKMIKICSQTEPPTQFRPPKARLKELSDLANGFYGFGCPLPKCEQLAWECKEDFNVFMQDPEYALAHTFGTKKDGSMLKAVENLLRRFGL